MNRLTIDASVALKFFRDEPGSETARSYLPQLRNGAFTRAYELSAPILLALEVHNTLVKQLRRAAIDGEILSLAQPTLERYIAFDDVTQTLVERARMMSLTASAWARGQVLATDQSRLPFNIYDCIYMAHAERNRTTLLTADGEQAKIARQTFGLPVELLTSTNP